ARGALLAGATEPTVILRRALTGRATDLGFTRDRQLRCPSRQQPTWVAGPMTGSASLEGRRNASDFAEDQEARRTLVARGFGVVARLDEAGPGFAPIVCTLCRPLEFRRLQQALQSPGGIIGNIGHEAK